MSIVNALLPLALQIIGLWFEKNKDKKEARAAFLAFVEKMQATSGSSARLRSSYQSQIERLKKQEAQP